MPQKCIKRNFTWTFTIVPSKVLQRESVSSAKILLAREAWVHKHANKWSRSLKTEPQLVEENLHPIRSKNKTISTLQHFCRITCSLKQREFKFDRECCCTHVSASKPSKTNSGAGSANEPSWCEWMRVRACACAWESESEMEIGLPPCPRCPSSWEESAVVWSSEGWLQIGWVYDTYLATLSKSVRWDSKFKCATGMLKYSL